jgi:dTDP-4-amino-4,6-dideoxygalactose transaminase
MIQPIPFGRPMIGREEIDAVLHVLQGPILTHGDRCTEFEQAFSQFMGGGHSVTVSSGMAALHLSYFHLGIGPGDEVIVPAMTHNATVHAVELMGATPVFVDCDPRTGNVNPDAVAEAVTERTRAISVVHFLGIPAEMDRIIAIAEKHDLKVVEDAALSVGTRYDEVHVGLLGDMGIFSFYPVKHITTAEGGMFVTKHKDVEASVRRKRAFGVDRQHNERKIPGLYDVVELGLNYRMSELQAAIGIQQIKKADQFLQQRANNFARLKKHLEGEENLRVLDITSDRQISSHYCLTVVLENDLAGRRDDIILDLKERGIGTSIYYPHPVPRLSYYSGKYGYLPGQYPNAETISDHSIALPVGPHLTDDDIDRMAETFVAVKKEVPSEL